MKLHNKIKKLFFVINIGFTAPGMKGPILNQSTQIDSTPIETQADTMYAIFQGLSRKTNLCLAIRKVFKQGVKVAYVNAKGIHVFHLKDVPIKIYEPWILRTTFFGYYELFLVLAEEGVIKIEESMPLLLSLCPEFPLTNTQPNEGHALIPISKPAIPFLMRLLKKSDRFRAFCSPPKAEDSLLEEIKSDHLDNLTHLQILQILTMRPEILPSVVRKDLIRYLLFNKLIPQEVLETLKRRVLALGSISAPTLAGDPTDYEDTAVEAIETTRAIEPKGLFLRANKRKGVAWEEFCPTDHASLIEPDKSCVSID